MSRGDGQPGGGRDRPDRGCVCCSVSDEGGVVACLVLGEVLVHPVGLISALAGGSGGVASYVCCRMGRRNALAGDPAHSLPLLQKRLTRTRAPGPTDAEIGQMIKNLDADEFAVREKASADLGKAGTRALSALQKVMAHPPSQPSLRHAGQDLGCAAAAAVERPGHGTDHFELLIDAINQSLT